MAALVSKLKVIAYAGLSQHDTIEPLVVFERADDFKVKSLLVHLYDSLQLICWAGNTEVSIHDGT